MASPIRALLLFNDAGIFKKKSRENRIKFELPEGK